jgi:hypothetical protein
MNARSAGEEQHTPIPGLGFFRIAFFSSPSFLLMLLHAQMSSEGKKTVDVCVVGDAFMDVVAAGMEGPPAMGQNVDCESFTMHTGGSGGNVASHIVALSPSYRCKYIAGSNSIGLRKLLC